MKPVFFLAVMFFLLTGCVSPTATPLQGAAPTIPAPTLTFALSTTPLHPTLTILSETPSATHFQDVSETPAHTATITDTPTRIPLPLTAGPTFNIRKVRTVTPAPQAICPKEDPAIKPTFPAQHLVDTAELLSYLNSGGSVNLLIERSDKLITEKDVADITGDGVKEIIYASGGRGYSFLSCKNGAYESLFHFFDGGEHRDDFKETVDLNQNGIPEVIMSQIWSRTESIFIYEWDGSAFRSLIKIQHNPFDTSSDSIVDWVAVYFDPYQLVDTNGDGLKEMVLVHSPSGFNATDGYVAYNETIILGWDGKNYINLKPGNYSPPFYRFQAVQLGDMQALYGNYEYAFASYEQAIFNDKLEWWSEERQTYMVRIYLSDYNTITPIAAPSPIPDLTERSKLSAYTYYRMMILHIYLHQMYAAKTDYAALQEKFPDGNPGHPYAEMATIFWDSYKSTQKIGEACNKITSYVKAHEELLEPFGFRGWWSHIYTPADVCPFR